MEVEIFRPGEFKSMEGVDVCMTPDILRAIAGIYDAVRHDAPVVIGHPEHDSPAHGWVKALRYDAGRGRLLADIDNLTPEFRQAVKAGNYRKISASFFAPDSPANPHKGQFYLRHVGFLGAAAPGVPGLAAVSLAAGQTATFTFAGRLRPAFSDFVYAEVAACPAFSDFLVREGKNMGLFDSLKDLVSNVLGAEAADRLFGSDEMKNARASLEKASAENALENAAAEPAPQEPGENAAAGADSSDEDDAEKTGKRQAAASFADELHRREAALCRREQKLRRQAREAVRAADISFADEMVRTGRILPAHKAGLVRSLEALIPAGETSFADGSRGNPRDELKKMVHSLPVRISFADSLPAEDRGRASFEAPDNYVADPGQMDLYNRARKYQAEHPDVDWLKALQAVS